MPSIDDVLTFFVALLSDIEGFVESVLNEFLLQPLKDFGDEVTALQDALEILAGEIPDPDPALKSQVLTLYDVQLALREYERDNLRKLLLNRYKALAKLAKELFTSDILKEVVRQLI